MQDRPRILIVEDDPDLSGNLQDILEDIGYDLQCLSTGERALQIVSECPPDVALLDLRLPDVDGMELLGSLRERSPGMQIVVMTGYGSVETASRAIDDNVFAYLTKPVEVRHLCQTIQRAVECRDTERALRESEERYRILFETMARGVVYHDARGRVISANPAAERTLGLTLDEMLGWTSLDGNWLIIREDGSEVAYDDLPATIALRTGREVKDVVLGMRGPSTDTTRWMRLSSAPMFRPGEDTPYQTYTTIDDITERKLAEEALRESEEKYRRLYETMDQGVTYKDADGTIVSANPAALRILGLTQEQLIGVTPMDPSWHCIHEDGSFWPGETHPASIALETGKDVGDQVMGVMNPVEGRYRWINLHTKVEFLPGGDKPYRVCSTFEDITDRKIAEEALRQSEERYRKLHETMRDAFVQTSMDGRLVEFNDVYCQMLGYSAEELRAITYQELTPPRWHDFEEAIVREQIIGRGYSDVYEKEFRRKDGTIIPVELRSILSSDDEGHPIAMWAIIRDIGERKQAEEALRKTNEMLHAMVQQSPIAIDVLDRDGNILLWNPAAERLFGWSADEAIGKPPPFVTPDKEPEFRNRLRQVLDGKELDSVEASRVRKDGSPVQISSSSVPLRDSDGNVVGALGLIEDLTERQHLETQLRQSQHMEAVGRLSAGLAHEFKNQLMGISGYTELLQIKLGPDHPEFQLTNDLLACVDQAAKLVTQLQAFSRQRPSDPMPTNLTQLVEDAEQLFAQLLGEHISLRLDVGNRGRTVIADAGQVEQALVNLVINARDAMPEGGKVTIGIAGRRLDRFDLRGHPGVEPGDYMELSVSDTGIGMDEATRARAFEPFFTTKQSSERTGLGLAMVYAMLKQHGGMIEVDSEPGRGSTFRMFFPCSAACTSAETTAHSPGPMKGVGTVLLAEDEDTVRLPAKTVLEECGYTVLCAANGDEALQLFSRNSGNIDLVVLDLVMPGVGGRQAWETMRLTNSRLKVLFMSGHTSANASDHYAAPPDRPLLSKPFSLRVLAEKVAELIESAPEDVDC